MRCCDEARQGQRLRDGLHVVILGAPNAGKSSLLNALAGSDRAIVTAIPGTTRDVLREAVRVAGVELTLADTAGLRDTRDEIEAEGMRRARAELARADLALLVDRRQPRPGPAIPRPRRARQRMPARAAARMDRDQVRPRASSQRSTPCRSGFSRDQRRAGRG